MKLTCVTAVFNAVKAGNAEKLARCVRSVAALKTPHEHILVDGASTDGTVEFLRRLQDEIPSLKVISEKDTGIYNALNKGLRAAQGEWFYVLGSDDYICAPGVMDELLASTMEEDAIVAPVVYDGDPNYSFHKIADLQNLFFWGYGYCHQGLLLRTEIARRFGGFDERYRYCADGDLAMKVHKAHRPFRYTYEPYANFSPGGANEQNHAMVVEETFDFLQRNLELSDREKAMLRREAPPFRLAFRYWFSRDIAFRTSARHVFEARWGAFKHSVKEWLKGGGRSAKGEGHGTQSEKQVDGSRPRDPAYDVVKALLMYFIVVGHLGNYVSSCSFSFRTPILLSNLILGVAMPSFFAISGYFAASTFEKGLLPSLAKILGILWPVAAIGFVFGLWDYFTGTRWLLRLALYPYFFLTRELWFLRILVVVYAAGALVFRLTRSTPGRWIGFCAVYLLFVFDLDPLHCLFRVEEVKHMLPYFVFGLMVLRPYELHENRRLSILCGIAFLAVVCVEGNAWSAEHPMNFYKVPDGWRSLVLGTGPIFHCARSLVGMAGTVALLWSVRMLLRHWPASGKISTFGTTTLGVYIMHEWVFRNFYTHIGFPVPLYLTGLLSFLSFHCLIVLIRLSPISREIFFGDKCLSWLRSREWK